MSLREELLALREELSENTIRILDLIDRAVDDLPDDEEVDDGA